MPRTETIKSDYFRKGDVIRCVIKKVEMKNNNPVVIVSRTDNAFLERLLENEVPEIEEGHIVIRKIVRLPGERAKVAVESFDDRIDPVGACVGVKGSRIHGIVRELRNENIDVINYTTNISLFISRALTPAKPTSITLDTENMRASVSLDADQVSLAIGKGGTNIKLASKLTGYEIDVSRNKTASEEDLDDVDLEEFSDEIEQWIIDEFKKAGCDTAKSVLKLTNEELVRRIDLEEETIQEVVRILAAEFED
jgi:N utilization substance protein A